jgi:putative methanogen marker protein 4
MFDMSSIYKLARKSKAAIGIGCAGSSDAVSNSMERASSEGYAQVQVFKEPQRLVSSLKEDKIHAAVRGTLSAGEVLESLKTTFGLEKIMRVAFMKADDGNLVLLAPVGVDEGQSIEERLELVNFACELLARFGVGPQVGVMSGGRLEDMGRHIKVDETLIAGEKLTSLALDSGVAARHFGIEIEQAFLTSNVVIAPDGITGNLIFRTMHFFRGMKGIGAPVMGFEKIFVDTSRAKEDYTDSIALASALCGL